MAIIKKNSNKFADHIRKTKQLFSLKCHGHEKKKISMEINIHDLSIKRYKN